MSAPCYIFDVDGTLADCTHRLHFITGDKKDWDAFFGACGEDRPIHHIIILAGVISDGTAGSVVYASGRPERTRTATLEWMTRHKLPPGPLFMRADGDRRHDDIVKAEQLDAIVRAGFSPVMAFEDRSRVVEMWRRLGIPCAQVAPGDF